MNLLYRTLLNFMVFTLLYSTAYAFDSENGKILHNDNCVRCHEHSLYTRKESKIQSYPLLHERVVQCELMSELMWFEEEKDQVTTYLNDSFYHFNQGK